jgi:SSS family transporter
MAILIVIIYFALCLLIGFYVQSRVTDSVAYYLAGRKLGPWLAGVGRFAAVSSAFTFLGMLGLGYRLGFPFLVSIAVGLLFGFLFAQLLLSEVRRSGAISIADFLGKRYESAPIALVASIIAILAMFPHIIAQIKGAGVVGSMVLGLPASVSMIVLTAVFVAYVVLGGLWAVSWTDMLQGAWLLIFMAVPAIVAIASAGGIGPLFQAASQASPKFTQGLPTLSGWSHLGIAVVFIGSLMTFPAFLFWSLTTRDTRTLRKSFIVALVMAIIVYIAVAFVLAQGFIVAPGLKNPDEVFFHVFKHLFGSGFMLGMGAAAALAAIMSSNDAMLVAIAAIVGNDLYKLTGWRSTEKQLLAIGRAVSVIIAAIALLFAFQTPAIIGQLTALAAGSAGSAFVFPMVLGVWWKRTTGTGAIMGMIGGYFAFILLTFFGGMPPQTPILLAMPISAVLCIFGSFVTAPSPSQSVFVDSLHKID